MKTVSIWDSTYRYRTFRLENASPRPLHAVNGDHDDQRYIPQRVRLTYVDPNSDGNWRTSMVDVEGFNPVTLAPVFLHYKEPGFGDAPRKGADWLPEDLRQVAVANLPGGIEGDGLVVSQPEPDPQPSSPLAIEPTPSDSVETSPNLFKVAEVKTLAGQNLPSVVTWGKGVPDSEAVTQVVPQLNSSEGVTQVIPKEDPSATQLLPQVEVDE